MGGGAGVMGLVVVAVVVQDARRADLFRVVSSPIKVVLSPIN